MNEQLDDEMIVELEDEEDEAEEKARLQEEYEWIHSKLPPEAFKK